MHATDDETSSGIGSSETGEGGRFSAFGEAGVDGFLLRWQGHLERGVRRAYAYHDLVHTEDDVREMVQEVYCRLLEADGRRLRAIWARHEAQVSAFLFRLSSRVVFSHLRRSRALKRTGRARGVGGRVIDPDEISKLQDRCCDPEEMVLLREQWGQLLAACRQLLRETTGRRNLQIFFWMLLEGWTSREVSRRLGDGLGPKGVEAVLYRVRRKIAREKVRVTRSPSLLRSGFASAEVEVRA